MVAHIYYSVFPWRMAVESLSLMSACNSFAFFRLVIVVVIIVVDFFVFVYPRRSVFFVWGGSFQAASLNYLRFKYWIPSCFSVSIKI